MRVFTAMGAAVFVRCVFAGSGGVDGSLCCPNCPPGPCGKSRTALTPLSDDNIQDAVRAWCDDPASAAKVYGDIASWDTGAVTNMTYLFGTTADGGTCATFATFNEDVSRWNTSRVTSMYKTFYFARTFDGDVSSWDTSNVTTMRDMFRNASSFSGDLSSWDTSRVTDMRGAPAATARRGERSPRRASGVPLCLSVELFHVCLCYTYFAQSPSLFGF